MTQPKFSITVFADGVDGAELELALPAKFEVCHRCQGTGTHTNPSIDGNGITASEIAGMPPSWPREVRSEA